MKTEKNILVAFILNLLFSVLEFAGGILTGSVAILSDAVHDMGDAAGIGLSCFLESKSRRKPDGIYTYGYARFSVLGGVLTALTLLLGSVVIICNAVDRLIRPVEINYNGMIGLAIIGVCVNACAAIVTHRGDSLNQKAVSLHMLEDVLGWLVVLVGAVIMRFTDIGIIDPIMSAGVAVFVAVHAVGHLKEGMGILLERVPCDISVEKLRECLLAVPGVLNIHHLHLWTLDGNMHCATVHIVTEAEPAAIKKTVRKRMSELGIGHVTLETEGKAEACEKCLLTEGRETLKHGHYH